jgi:hypothetical protein
VPGASGERKGDFTMNVERERGGLEGAHGWFGSVQPAWGGDGQVIGCWFGGTS